MLLSQGVNVGATVITLALSARYLGVERFGQQAVLRAIALFALPLLAGGLRVNIIREIGRDPQAAPSYLGNVLALRWVLALGAAAMAAVVVRALPLRADLELASYAAILLAISGVWYSVPRAVFVAYERNEFNLLMSIASKLLAVLLTVAAIRLDTGIAGILTASALPGFAVAQTALFLIHRHLVRVRLTVDLPQWREILKSAAPLGVSGTLKRSYAHIGVWLLAALKGAAGAGMFSVAYRVTVQVTSASIVIGGAILPRISLLARSRQDQLRIAVERLLLLMLAASVPAAGVVAACADPLVTFVVGPQFGGSIAALRLVAVIFVTALPDALLFYVLVALGKEMAATACLATMVAANLALNIALIPPMGVAGACLGAIGAEWVYFILSLVLVHRALRISSLWRFVGKPVLAGAGMALAVWIAGPHRPVLGVLSGLSAFALVFLLLRVLPRESIRALRQALAVGAAQTPPAAAPLAASAHEYE